MGLDYKKGKKTVIPTNGYVDYVDVTEPIKDIEATFGIKAGKKPLKK